ncbi:hypothetical protein KIP88_01065 [Bradyrhizobium sp. SRL28]|uniref:hypothetical protein n=1 Tax=Bradyrhizobium sp. SRL28 TaxID=2836178 RepID=UPI001BDF607F|nr:hypothetical protein [Bradyrhizobium sp. SRL28]MBT1509077.1 hypothetical protein [Bradyrhizobium sp. SRL28]
MSDLARSNKGTHDVRARGLPQFPVMPYLKTGTERCCILSGITAREHFTRCTLMSSRHALRAIALLVGKPRRNPVLKRDTVSILAKICGH